ncbi:MAG: Lon protease family protein [Desulfovibrionaceae bacterium]
MLLKYLQPKALLLPVPNDILYIHNFDLPEKPLYVELPAGQGRAFKAELNRTINRIKRSIKSCFEDEQYFQKHHTIMKNYQEEKDELVEKMDEIATKRGFTVDIDENGALLLSPIVEGKALEHEEYKKLNPDKKRLLRSGSDKLLSEISAYMRTMNQKDITLQEDEAKLNKDVVENVLDEHLTPLAGQYAHVGKLKLFFDSARAELLEHIDQLLPSSGAPLNIASALTDTAAASEDIFDKIRVNLFVDHSLTKGGPIVIAEHPTYFNLLGCLERESELGALHTGFDLIRSGDLHKANHGFLILRVEDILANPSSWEGLLRTLRSGHSKIEDPVDIEQSKTKTIEPEPLPIDLKIILVGDESTYELLLYADNRFQKHFKIKAQLQEVADRTTENIHLFLQCLSHIIVRDKLCPFSIDALCELVDYASNLAEDQTKLSLKFSLLRERMLEAAALSASSNQESVTHGLLLESFKQRNHRINLYEHEFLSDYDRKIIKVATQGFAVGRANGLSVTCFGEHEFGLPHQIACNLGVGHGGILDLEREAEMGGPIHTKAMFIIKSYLIGLFAQNKPIVMTGSLCFEQSYAGVEGDSASGAELAALLSALADTPINLSYAFTGAIGQSGAVMAVGGVSQKVEGFFNVCKRHGLTGEQGVLLPYDNIDSLMLNDDVIAAVADKQFSIIPVKTIEEAMEVLTGLPCGTRSADGVFEVGSLYSLIDNRLSELFSAAGKSNLCLASFAKAN